MNDTYSATLPGDIVPLQAFNDNYIWLIRQHDRAVVVNPGDSVPVLAWLDAQGVRLEAILLTHHHADHVGGVAELLARFPALRVIGPADSRIAGIVTEPATDGTQPILFDNTLSLQVLAVPGHTETHVAYHGHGMLFCGDTLFSAGCGRLLGGRADQLHASLQSLAGLPDETRIYPAHEYTLSNLRFARAAEPVNAFRDAYLLACEKRRAKGLPTLPSTLGVERRINPFLRLDAPSLRDTLAQRLGTPPTDALACFTALRAWKDVF